MSDFFTFGPTGHGVAVDPSGRVIAVTSPGTGAYVFGYGSTGRPMLVDDIGRLIVSLQAPSGTILPDPSAYGFGDRFYVVGGAQPGFYIRGISNWEYATSSPPSGGGEINTGANVGGGVGIYSAKSANELQFHSLGAGSGIKLTLAADKITIDNKVTRGLDMPIADAGNYYAVNNVEAALQSAGAKAVADKKNFTDASGLWVKSLASAGGMTQVKTGTAPALSIKGLTAVSGLGLVAGTNAISIGLHVPSGRGNPPDFASSSLASLYYHEISGYMMRGQDKWQRITTPQTYWAKVWFDASPLTGPALTLTNANQYYKVTNYVAASGDQAVGVGGITILSSGIKLDGAQAEGDYSINVSCTVNATNNKNFWMSLFDQETRIKSSTVGFRGTGQIFSNFATTIYPINRNRVLNVRFMCTTTGGAVRIDTINLTMNREHKHNRG